MIVAIKKMANKIITDNKQSIDRNYSRISLIHKYWSRKPWYIVRDSIKKYSKYNDTVLDPFCGSGIIGLESILLGRRFIGYDLNPTATFISKNTLKTEFDTNIFEKELHELDSSLKERIMSLYRLKDNITRYSIYIIAGPKHDKPYNCVSADYDFKHKEKIRLSHQDMFPKVTFPENIKYPDMDFPKKFYKDRFSYKGVSKVSDMFTKRNLLAMAILYNHIKISKYRYKNLFMLAFNNTLLHVSRLKSENVRPLGVNNYWMPDDYIEENVWWRYIDRVKNVMVAKEEVIKRIEEEKIKKLGTFTIYNKSSLVLAEIASDSIDYILTDPPYGDAIQYSELSYIWNCWLGKYFDINKEVIINPEQDKGLNEYKIQIEQFISETYRVLKDKGYFTLCFQNKDINIWFTVIEMVKKHNMRLTDIEVNDTLGNPYNKNWAKFSPKSDFYVTFQKKEEKLTKSKEKVIYPYDIMRYLASYIRENDIKDTGLNKIYDLFVASVIKESFSNKIVANMNKLNLKDVVMIVKDIAENGNKQKCFF